MNPYVPHADPHEFLTHQYFLPSSTPQPTTEIIWLISSNTVGVGSLNTPVPVKVWNEGVASMPQATGPLAYISYMIGSSKVTLSNVSTL
jgi:hypothetical protein